MPVRPMRLLARALLGAMLLAALAPAISRALASTRGAGDWVEICTTTGMRWVQLQAPGPQGATADADDLAHALDFCGHCSLAAERFAPLIPSLPAVAVLPGQRSPPGYIARAARSCAAPHPAARGPPLLV
jgi:hypothetical protein